MNVLKLTSPYRRTLKAAGVITAMSALLALAACGGEKAPDPAATAKGELLPRSISDDMPPYDTVKSQPPLQNPAPEIEGRTGGGPAAPSLPEGDETDAAPTAAARSEAASPAPSTPAAE